MASNQESFLANQNSSWKQNLKNTFDKWKVCVRCQWNVNKLQKTNLKYMDFKEGGQNYPLFYFWKCRDWNESRNLADGYL